MISALWIRTIGTVIGSARKGNFDRTHHVNHITEAHGISKPAHRLLGVATALGITGLVFVRFGKEGQPAEAAGLHHREVEIGGLGVGDALAFLLNKEPQPQIVKLGHGTGFTGATLAGVLDLATPLNVVSTTGLAGLEPTTRGSNACRQSRYLRELSLIQRKAPTLE
jgi:hypothetical protein